MERIGIPRDGVLMVHSSFKTLGREGHDAPAVLQAFVDYMASGTLLLPTMRLPGGTGVGGTVTATPSPAPLPGLTGTFYRERQDFSLTPVPTAGSYFGQWSGSYFFGVASDPCPLTLATNSRLPSGDTRIAPGYQPVGISPSTRLAFGRSASSGHVEQLRSARQPRPGWAARQARGVPRNQLGYGHCLAHAGGDGRHHRQ